MYRRAPYLSKAYVAWEAFIGIQIGLYMPIVSALLWIIFELGKLSGKIS